MAQQAECVMLNKGPHIEEAVRTLDDILRRTARHQRKKMPLLDSSGAGINSLTPSDSELSLGHLASRPLWQL